MAKKIDLRGFLKTKMFTLLALEAALIVIFSIWAKAMGNNFLAPSTLYTLLDSIVVTSFLAIGAGCLLISGEIDLAQSAIGAFGGVIVAVAVKYMELPWPIAILLALALCAGFGAINALLVTKFRFQAFIATLGMASVVKGLMMFVSVPEGGTSPQSTSFTNPGLQFIGSGRIGGVFPIAIIFMIIAFVIYGVIMSKTKFGLRVYMVGGNAKAAYLAGISPHVILLILFINSAVLGGIAGSLAASRSMLGSIQALSTAQFTGLTAAVLGGISFGGGTGGIGGAFVGLVIINTFQTGMSLVNINPFWTTAFSGIILLAALTLDYFSMRSRTALS